MAQRISETETVVKKIIPYLLRRGFDLDEELDFESPAVMGDRYSKGYVDIIVRGKDKRAQFAIEAKRLLRPLTTKDRDQALAYGRSTSVRVPFVVVTNGRDIQCFNTQTGKRISWDGKGDAKIPSKSEITNVLKQLRADKEAISISLSNDKSLPFRPGLPPRQLNALFYRCHSAIRKNEKTEEYAFSDFSKLLFLKLLEEKADLETDFVLPYSYRFFELAEKSENEADQIRDSIDSMIRGVIKSKGYGDVLNEPIRLKNPRTFIYIVRELSAVSFCDCSLDSKGAAFEYFVRATLKGKKLGQYFTPRELVRAMSSIVGEEKLINSVIGGSPLRVLDPACGTGGFLVYLLNQALEQLASKLRGRTISKRTYDEARTKIKEQVFFGSDANEGVAASAKMNMIIAGDGHSNIRHEDSLSLSAKNWSLATPNCDILITNPPFGTSEMDSLTSQDLQQFPIVGGKGQYLFLQKMVLSVRPDGGEICTVIDEGVLNTESGIELRKWILQQCKLIAVLNLPAETFKPNKINVKASVLYLERRQVADTNYSDEYDVVMGNLESLGFAGSGERLRGFDFEKFFTELGSDFLSGDAPEKKGYMWSTFRLPVRDIHEDDTCRFDVRYWSRELRNAEKTIKESRHATIKALNTIPTSRGVSPPADNYVDEADGFAVVLKAGSSINRFGEVTLDGADWIEKALYDEYVEAANNTGTNRNLVLKGDILLSSTGDGTLGKAGVYCEDIPAIADGHITIIRVAQDVVDPFYLCDFLRAGRGARQVQRFFTGSTGMVELSKESVERIVVDLRRNVGEQKKVSEKLRKLENEYRATAKSAEDLKSRLSEMML